MPKQTPPPAPSYIWQHAAWPRLTFDALALDQARLEQGKLLGLLEAIGLEQAQEVQRGGARGQVLQYHIDLGKTLRKL